jgi:hypothetical protein
VAAAARREALALHGEGAFSAAPRAALPAPRRAGAGDASAAAPAPFTDASARGDAVLWLHPGAPPAACAPGLSTALVALSSLRDDVARLLRLSPAAATATEHQLAVYPPSGAAYARHRDALPDDGGGEESSGGGASASAQQRRVTMVCYANEPDWDVARDGGALRLHVPPPQRGDEDLAAGGGGDDDGVTVAGASWVDVVPRGGACVLFLSGAVEHEVMPCAAHRVALTAWCS